MKTILLSSGEYLDYGVIGFVQVPDGVDVTQVYRDWGNDRAALHCEVHERPPVRAYSDRDFQEWYKARNDEEKQTRAARGWLPNNTDEFMRRLRFLGCVPLEYEEINLDDD